MAHLRRVNHTPYTRRLLAKLCALALEASLTPPTLYTRRRLAKLCALALEASLTPAPELEVELEGSAGVANSPGVYGDKLLQVLQISQTHENPCTLAFHRAGAWRDTAPSCNAPASDLSRWFVEAHCSELQCSRL